MREHAGHANASQLSHAAPLAFVKSEISNKLIV
jgi:hypothetical protein